MQNQEITNFLRAEPPMGMQSQEEWSKYIELITEEKAIPEEIKKLFWAFSDTENVLSNLKEADIKKIMNNLEITFNFWQMSQPPYKYKFDVEIMFWQLKSKLLLKLKRSEGGFERKMQATQIKEIFADNREKTGGGKIQGFFNKMFGR